MIYSKTIVPLGTDVIRSDGGQWTGNEVLDAIWVLTQKVNHVMSQTTTIETDIATLVAANAANQAALAEIGTAVAEVATDMTSLQTLVANLVATQALPAADLAALQAAVAGATTNATAAQAMVTSAQTAASAADAVVALGTATATASST